MLNSPIDEIKNRLNVVDVIRDYIKLQKVGASYRAVCPFHSEKKPSFFVSPARQIWHCFGCGAGSNIFDFVMKIEGVEFGDALRILAQKAGVELKRQSPELRSQRRRLFEICQLSCSFFQKQLEESSVGKEAKKYLLERGIKEESIKKWRLGYSPDRWQGLSDFLVSQGYKREEIVKAGLAIRPEKEGNPYDRFRGRIMFPVFNISSQVIGFGARIFEAQNLKRKTQSDDGVAKYINTPSTLLYDKSRVLYGLNNAGVPMRKKDACVLVEGYVDVIMADQQSFENIVATSGTALTNYQLDILKRYSENLLIAFDMDIAGDTATKRGIDSAQSAGFNIKIVTMPEGKDPADVISGDPKEWESLVEKAKTIRDFYFENSISKFDKNTLEGKKGISKTLLPIIKRIPNKIEETIWIQDLARLLGVKEEDVREELAKTKIENFLTQKAPVPQEDKDIQKSRKEILEEYLAVLSIKNPESLTLVKEDDFNFLSPQFFQIINCLKNNRGQISKLPLENQDFINYLGLKAEILEIEPGIKIQDEFNCCLKAIKTLGIKKKLDDLSLKIRKAEEEEPDKIQKLMEEFNLYSKLRKELETA